MNSDKTETFESGYAPLNGLNMYYEIHGTGKMPLVLLHGGGSTIDTTFGYVLPLLSAKRKLVAVELQAHGRTSDRNGPETFKQDAKDVADLLAYLHIDKADFFGFSNGSNTATQLVLDYPSLVNKLVLASSFYKREGLMKGFFEGMDHASLDNMPQPLQAAFLKLTGDKNKLQTMHDKDKQRMIEFTGWTDAEMRSIQVPALLIAGDQDVVTPEHTVEMLQTMPNAKLMILPGNHGSYLGEACTIKEGSKIPEMTVAVIEEFLDE